MALLRASSSALGSAIDVSSALAVGEGVPAGDVLLRFAVAAHHGTSDLATARRDVLDAIGPAGLAEASLTVSEVRMSRDLRHATAYVIELGGELRGELLDALERAAPWLRGEAARRVHLKYAPTLSFRVDPSFAEAARIDALLARERASHERAREDDDGQG